MKTHAYSTQEMKYADLQPFKLSLT